MTQEHHKKFPVGKVPACAYRETDVTITTTTERLIISVTCNGLEAGTPICIKAEATVALGAGSDKVDVDIVEGTAYTGTDVGEASEVLVTASKDAYVHQMVYDTAFQSNPTYSMTIKVTNASADSTVQSACILVIPVGA